MFILIKVYGIFTVLWKKFAIKQTPQYSFVLQWSLDNCSLQLQSEIITKDIRIILPVGPQQHNWCFKYRSALGTEKKIYEIGFHLRNRITWFPIIIHTTLPPDKGEYAFLLILFLRSVSLMIRTLSWQSYRPLTSYSIVNRHGLCPNLHDN